MRVGKESINPPSLAPASVISNLGFCFMFMLEVSYSFPGCCRRLTLPLCELYVSWCLKVLTSKEGRELKRRKKNTVIRVLGWFV